MLIRLIPKVTRCQPDKHGLYVASVQEIADCSATFASKKLAPDQRDWEKPPVGRASVGGTLDGVTRRTNPNGDGGVR